MHAAANLSAASPADPVAALAEAERQAFECFDAACRLSDPVALGREPTGQEDADLDAASTAQFSALLALMSATPTTTAGLEAMIDRFCDRELENVPAPVDSLLFELFDSVRRFAAARA